MKYKVGDKVRAVKGIDGSPQFPQFSPGGVVGTVTDVNPTALFAYTVADEAGTVYFYPATALEPYIEKTYEEGLADAWELAKKIAKMSCDECRDIFGKGGFHLVAYGFTVEEALAKIEAYEQGKEAKDFKIGDEVIMLDYHNRTMKGCVVGFYTDESFYVADKNGGICEWEKDRLTKTGVHYDEIENVFARLDDDYER